MGPIGLPELLVIGVIALLIFGPRKLPELGRSLGQGISEFKRATTHFTDSLTADRPDPRDPPDDRRP